MPDILHKEMCTGSILRAGVLLKWEFFTPPQKVLCCSQTLIEIGYGHRVVVVGGRLQWIYIREGGRSDMENVNTSHGGSLGYISSLSSDISAQVSFCGRGGIKTGSWKQWKQNQ